LDVLITGTGFAGSNAARKFIDEGYSVVALDLNPVRPDYLEGLEGKLKIAKEDVTSVTALNEIIEKEHPKILVHTATFLNPMESFNVFEINVRGTAVALELSRKHDLTLVYLSSGAIYGQMEGDGDIYEDEKFGPVYPPREYDNASGTSYSISKRLGEEWGSMYRDLYGLRVSALRLTWVYGPGIADYRLNSGISLFLRKALVGQPLMLPYGGDSFCDFVYVADVADAIYKAALAGLTKHFAYNISYERGYYMKEVVELVKKILPDAKLALGPGQWPSKGVPITRGGISWPSSRHMNVSRAKEDFSFNPSFDLDRGIREYLTWIQKNWDLCSPEKVPFKA
jgi:nucleoside-diphosphate-sugar epimerase